MKGLDLARAYYEQFGRPMLEKEFAPYLDRIAVGLVGHGSECFGYDDAISQDHDYEPGFCLWIRQEDDQRFGFRLFRAYSKLPKEFQGVRCKSKSALGSHGKGVHTIEEFYAFYTGLSGPPQTLEQWLQIPSFYLAEATNGQVFADPLGEFTRIRETLLHGMPRDVQLKKLASCLFTMAQAGQYNYSRCLAHGEKAAGALALSEFVRHAAKAIFLLNGAHAPYYKWMFRAMASLPRLSQCRQDLEAMLAAPFAEEENLPRIETVCGKVIALMEEKGLVSPAGDYLESYAYAINDKITDGALRNQPVML